MTSDLFIRIPAVTKRGERLGLYHLTRMPDSEGVRVAWRLVGKNGPHVVTAYTNGVVDCDCHDWTFRRSSFGEDCKHIAGLREQRLIPAKDK